MFLLFLHIFSCSTSWIERYTAYFNVYISFLSKKSFLKENKTIKQLKFWTQNTFGVERKNLVFMKMHTNVSDSFCEDWWKKQCDVMIAFSLFFLSLYM